MTSVLVSVSPPDSDDLSVTISLLEPRPLEGSFGGNPVVCTITRSAGIAESRLVHWRLYGSGEVPVSASDFDSAAGTVLFEPGETTRTVTLWTIGDFAIEPAEGFTVSADDPTSGTDFGTPAHGTLVDDDTRIAIAALVPAVREGSIDGAGAEILFEVTRRGDLTGTHVLPWTVVPPGSGAGFLDFLPGGTLPSGVLTFAPGEASKTIAVRVAADTEVEADESFTVQVPDMVGVIEGPNWASATILNDDAQVELRRLSYGEDEGDAGTAAFAFELLRTGDTSQAHTISWKVTEEWKLLGVYSADAQDFAGGSFPNGAVTFEPGETRKTFTVLASGDTTSETDEGFLVQLADLPAGVTATWGVSWNYIRNDDPLPVAAHNDSYVTTGKLVLSPFSSSRKGVLGNDIGADAVALETGPAHGAIALQADGSFTYEPDPGFTGIDRFTYRASGPDGAGEARVTIHVVPLTRGHGTTLDLLALTAEEQIAATYVAFMGRAADAAGFAFWVDQFHGGVIQGPKALLANIASSFAISEEAKGLHAFLADPGTASDGEIGSFLDGVYHNLFNRPADAGGLAYWTGQVRDRIAAGAFVGSVLVDIMGGAQRQSSVPDLSTNTIYALGMPDGDDIGALMGKVAVSLEFVRAQQEHGMVWTGALDIAAATDLLQDVGSAVNSVLLGIKLGDDHVAAHG